MTISIRHPRANELARKIASDTGKPITTVVVEALEDYAARHSPESNKEARYRRLKEFLAEAERRPAKDRRSGKELIEELYDERGLPK